MAARAIWKGLLKIGSTKLPVKLYAAVQDRKVHFHVLQAGTKSRVKQRMIREEGSEVPREEIRKGYEVEPGTFVILEDQELDRLKPKESHDIQTTRFVSPSQLSNEWYERPYYLGPDGEETKYFALAAALQKRKVQGIVRWSMRGKAYLGALRTEGDYLLLVKIRYVEEVLPAHGLPVPGGPSLAEKELRLAHELVSALEGKFEPEEFRDEYRERLSEFINAKAKGRHPRLPAVKERRISASLGDQLSKSLAALKRGREKKVA